jgi:hypothetical protein
MEKKWDLRKCFSAAEGSNAASPRSAGGAGFTAESWQGLRNAPWPMNPLCADLTLEPTWESKGNIGMQPRHVQNEGRRVDVMQQPRLTVYTLALCYRSDSAGHFVLNTGKKPGRLLPGRFPT